MTSQYRGSDNRYRQRLDNGLDACHSLCLDADDTLCLDLEARMRDRLCDRLWVVSYQDMRLVNKI